MSDWIAFSRRLPTRADADDRGYVVAKLTDGIERPCLWNWIQPDDANATELWRVNGFQCWRAAHPEGTP